MRIKLQPYAILRVKSDFFSIKVIRRSDCFRLGTDWLVKCKAVKPRLALPGKGICSRPGNDKERAGVAPVKTVRQLILSVLGKQATQYPIA